MTGLDIYKLLPKTNCKDCAFATCLAFAMALAQKKVSLDKCPHVTAQARASLESASQPPVKLVTIGTGDQKIEIGNETVMYRHEQKFHHPAGIGIFIEDTLKENEIDERISKINKLTFERVGQVISVNLICLKNESNSFPYAPHNGFSCKKTIFSVLILTTAPEYSLAILTTGVSLALSA